MSGQGLYLYTEASSGGAGDSTTITSPCIDLGALTTPRLEFTITYGDAIGELIVR